MKILTLCTATVWLSAAVACAERPVFIEPAEAAGHPDYAIQGEYAGQTAPETPWGLQVGSAGGEFFGVLYPGGLPGDGWSREGGDKVELSGKRANEVVELTGDGAPTLRYHDGSFQVLADDGEVLGTLEKTVRESPTMGKEPPEGAIVLFDGSGVDAWGRNKGMTDDGLLREGATTAQEFGDMQFHLEFKTAFMPGHGSQGRANSGVYIMNRYEVQILDSFAMPAKFDGCGSLYREQAPAINMSFPPLVWQTFDIDFRAPRFDSDGNKTENARITVRHNGVLIHDDLELEKGTGAGGRRAEVPKAELYLQDHGDPIRFRNVWLVEP